jgi:hypothetical protein
MHNQRRVRPRGWKGALAAVAATLLLAVNALAQNATGKIIGTVKDSSGAVVAGAQVKVTNAATNITQETVTDGDGNYQILLLPIGTYQITVEKSGFRKIVSSDEKLQINQSLRFDAALEVGADNEIVEVASQSALIETANPTLGASVTERPILNLPLNGRNVLQLALLQAGVTETNPGNGGAGNFSISGGRNDSVTFLLDGGNNNNLLNNGVVLNPNPDAIAEFRILTSNYTAEYGRNGGGIISVVTKSGTNQLHGSVYDFLRNDALNANSFFNNRDGVPREVLKRNQFGFTVGGPILIPKLVNGKDRFFFFASYQGQRQTQTVSPAGGATTVFTPAQLRGDFSNLTQPDGSNPVAAFLQQNPFFQSNPALAARGIIDPARINPVAQRYISAGLIPSSPTGQIRPQGSAKNDSDELTLKFDMRLTDKDSLSVTLGSARNPQLLPFSGTNVPGFPVTTNVNRYFANFTYLRSFTPTFLNEFRFTAQRFNQRQLFPAQDSPTAADLGIGITPDVATGPPVLFFDSGMTVGFNTNGPTTLINNTFGYSNTSTWQKGAHTFKFGGSFSPYQNNTVFAFFVNGSFTFSGSSGGIGANNDLADFLLGLPDQYTQFGNAPSNIRTKSVYGFFQDEWRVRPNLTLTYGLRYEYSQPKFDTQGRSFSLGLGQQSTVFPNAPTGLLFPGDANAPRGSNFSDKNDFAPRVGFAYSPFKNGKTSVRGGFGIFYDILKGEDNLQFNGQAPFFGFAFLDFTQVGLDLTQQQNLLLQPFTVAGIPNSFPSRPPDRNLDFGAAGFLPAGGGGVFYVDRNLRTPYSMQYNLSLQHEIVKDVVVEANYVGSQSRKLTGLVDANPFNLGTRVRQFNVAPDGSNTGNFSFLPEFRNVGTANYNALQLSVNKRPSKTRFIGTTYLTFGYTWSRTMDSLSGFRNRNNAVPAFDPKLFYAAADFDVRQRVTLSGGWDLPFDDLFKSAPKALTKGWSVYPIFSYRTGFPLDVFAGFAQSGGRPGPSGAGDSQLVRANLGRAGIVQFDPRQFQSFANPNIGAAPGGGSYFFDPATFNRTGLSATSLAPVTNAALRSYGTLGRNSFRGPSRTNFDFAIAKSTPIIKDKLNSEFRAEFFNLPNLAQFANPITNIGDPRFGQIVTTGDPRIIQFALRLTF